MSKLSFKLMKILSIVTCLLLVSTSVFATNNTDLDGKVVKVIVVQDGNTIILDGQRGADYLKQHRESSSQTNILNDFSLNRSPVITPYDLNTTEVIYKEISNNQEFHRPSLEKRITAYWRNTSSATQQYEFAWESGSEFSSSLTLSSTEKKAIGAELNSGYTYNISSSGKVTINVKPNKKMWMTYYPIQEKSTGDLCRYYQGRLHSKQRVTVYAPKRLYNGLVKKKVPDGVYTWRES